MKRCTFLLLVVATLAVVVAFTVLASPSVTSQDGNAVFVKTIPGLEGGLGGP